MIKLIDKKNKIEVEENIYYSKFIVNKNKINTDLLDFFNGKIKRGYKSGIYLLDKHFIFKDNEFYVLTGKKGSGKTTITQALQLIGSISNDLIWVVCFQENSEWSMKLNYMNYLLGDFALNIKKTNLELYKKVSDWVDEHFIFIEVDDIKTALYVTKNLIKKGKKIHAVLLDPINSFRNGFQETGNGYSDGVVAATEILKFTKKWANQRKLEAVTSYDAEGGWFLNKASFTYVIDREKGTNLNKIIVENVRNKHTGGSETDSENPLILEWSPNNINIRYNNDIHKSVNVIQKIILENGLFELTESSKNELIESNKNEFDREIFEDNFI